MVSILICFSYLLVGGYYWYGIWILCYKRLLLVNDVGGKKVSIFLGYLWVVGDWILCYLVRIFLVFFKFLYFCCIISWFLVYRYVFDYLYYM